MDILEHGLDPVESSLHTHDPGSSRTTLPGLGLDDEGAAPWSSPGGDEPACEPADARRVPASIAARDRAAGVTTVTSKNCRNRRHERHRKPIEQQHSRREQGRALLKSPCLFQGRQTDTQTKHSHTAVLDLLVKLVQISSG